MRFKGTIAEWNDDRGFGFIKPAEGGDQVFCHIKAFQERSRRPALNATVTYEVARDERGRSQAREIRYASVSATRRSTQPSAATDSNSLTKAIAGSAVFLVVVFIAVAMGRLTWWVLPWYAALSAATFLLYGWDKSSARTGHWRTQESTLNGLALLGGWPGAWIAQHAWRHKSRKESFQEAFWLAVVVNIVVFGVLVYLRGDLSGLLELRN